MREVDKGPEQSLGEQIKTHLRKISSEGRSLVNPTDPKYGLIVGVSMESLWYMMDRGMLDQRTENMTRVPAGEHTGLFARQAKMLATPYAGSYYFGGEVRNAVMEDAMKIAQAHAFAEIVGVPLDARESQAVATYWDNIGQLDLDGRVGERVDALTDRLRQREVPRENILFAQEQARKRRGFILGISPEIAHDPNIQVHEAWKGGMYAVDIQTQGIPYKYISGIEYQGAVEKNFFETQIMSSPTFKMH